MSLGTYVANPPFIGLLQFETSTICNGRCVFCHHKDMKRKGIASWSTILDVIDICVPYAETVCPFLMQEPLLEPRLCGILDNIKQVNPKAKTQIYTNMAKLPENWKSLIAEQNLDLMIISFYGPTPELYRKYQPAFDWNQTRANIHKFMKYRKGMGYTRPLVKMHYIALPDLLGPKNQTAKLFFKDWHGIVDQIGTTVYRTHDEEDPCFQSLSDVEKFEQGLYGEPPPIRVPCQRLWSGFYVLFNGDVVPCSADYDGLNVLGNIHDEDPRKIWWGKKARDFRQKHVDGEFDSLDLCRHCNYWKYEMSEEWVTYWVLKQTGFRGSPSITVKSQK